MLKTYSNCTCAGQTLGYEASDTWIPRFTRNSSHYTVSHCKLCCYCMFTLYDFYVIATNQFLIEGFNRPYPNCMIEFDVIPFF